MTTEDESDVIFEYVKIKDLKDGMIINHSPIKGKSSLMYIVVDTQNSFNDLIMVRCLNDGGEMTNLLFDLSFDPDLTVRVVGNL